jgi:hypothetical protein
MPTDTPHDDVTLSSIYFAFSLFFVLSFFHLHFFFSHHPLTFFLLFTLDTMEPYNGKYAVQYDEVHHIYRNVAATGGLLERPRTPHYKNLKGTTLAHLFDFMANEFGDNDFMGWRDLVKVPPPLALCYVVHVLMLVLTLTILTTRRTMLKGNPQTATGRLGPTMNSLTISGCRTVLPKRRRIRSAWESRTLAFRRATLSLSLQVHGMFDACYSWLKWASRICNG